VFIRPIRAYNELPAHGLKRPQPKLAWRIFFVKRFALILAIIAAMAIPAAAQAQSSGYGEVAGATQGASGGPSSPGAASTSAPVGSVATAGEEVDGGVLPFTGLQLALIFGAGVLLLGTGLMLRRARAE
jgi:hypothetical protein